MSGGTKLVEGLGFAEGLRWRDGELWFSDFRDRTILSVDIAGNLTQRAYVPGQPSGIGWAPDGTLLVSSMIDQKLVSFDAQGRRRMVASLEALAVGPVNDMIVDAKGRVYIGSQGADVLYDEITAENALQKLQPVPLVMVSPEGEVSIAAEDMGVPNGMAWTSDGRLLVAETLRGRISVFDVADDGSLGNRQTYADLHGMPDGMCIDAEDAVWAAMVFDGKFVRATKDGRIVEEIVVPEGGVAVDCALGGPDGKTLFGAVSHGDIRIWSDGQVKSSIYTWQVGVPGPDF